MNRKRVDLGLTKARLAQMEVPTEAIRAPDNIGGDEIEQAYYLSAAVLTTFDPWQLRPFRQPNTESRVVESMLDSCTLRYDDDNRPRWMLRHRARKEALAVLKTRDRLLEALSLSDPRPTERLQEIFEACLSGDLPSLDAQPLADLRHTLQAVEWLTGTELSAELPDAGEIQRRIAWEEMIQPFRYLLARGFSGRDAELQQMAEFLSDPNLPPLLVYGPGGVGKSTLMAEFIMRQAIRAPKTSEPRSSTSTSMSRR
ncbi:MAG: hypothetical protein R2856_27550 [Caldilineaceae bacterium]